MEYILDATVVRQPASGVQNAVLHEANAIKKLHPSCCIFNSNVITRKPAFRILWQQLMLPMHAGDVLYAMAYTAPLFTNIPYLLNVHDVIALTHPQLCSNLNAAQMRILMPRSIKRAAHIIVSTNYVAGRIKKLFPDKKITVAPLGVDFDYYSKDSVLLPAWVRKPYYLFVGNIEPKKGLDTLINAFSQTKKTLIIAGKKGWKCENLLKKVPENIIFAGRVADEILPALYKNAEALILPSIEEGFGLPVLEAMAAGTPVIHSDIPALMETAGNAGLPFAVSDVASLQSAVNRLEQSSTLRSELICAGKKHAASFTWEKRAAIALDILKSI